MIAVEDIVDRDSFRAWLDELAQDRDEASYRALVSGLAMRSAARVLPIYWNWSLTSERARKRDLTALPLMRSLLISSVASLAPTDDIRVRAADTAAAYAADAADTAADTAAADTAADAAYAAYAAYAAAAAADAAADADTAAADAAADAAAAYADTAAIWTEIRADCRAILAGDDIAKRGLWQEGGFPADDPWPGLEGRIRGQSGDWDFWVAWYNKLRAGETMPIELLTKIALIEPDTWDKGAEVVNPIIAQMWFDAGSERTLNGETVVLDADTLRLHAVPETSLPGDHLADVLDKLRDANRIFEGEDGANRMYEILQPEQQIVTDALDRYAARPMRLFDASRRAAGRVRQKVEAGDCPANDALINDYLEQLDQAAVDLRGFDETIQKVTTNRVIEGMKDLPREQVEDIITAADEVAAGADGYMAEELPEAARSGVDQSKPTAERKEFLNRAIGLLLRSWKVGREVLADSAKLAKDVGIVGGVIVGAIEGIPWLTGKLATVLPWLLSLF